ncbi:MAG: hypothetical protein HDR01_05790 [Lachnospiraceae bacterium]|nr:hypothetical protein [Lachnospiraceae bacterium]
MAYKGFLFQFGNYIFPNKYIKFDTYDILPDQRQDLDSYTDANGITHRNALKHTKSNITFSTLEMSESAMNEILKKLEENYSNENETDSNCIYFNPRKAWNPANAYQTGHFYLDPSLKFRIKKEDENGKSIKYGEMQWLFIEY